MKHGWTKCLFVLAGLLAGCSGEGLQSSPSTKGEPLPVSLPRASVPAAQAGTTRYELRLRGSNAAEVKSALFGLKAVTLTAGGNALAFHPVDVIVDLGDTESAHLLGYMDVPAGVDRFQLDVQLDDFGAFENAGTSDVVDAQTLSLGAEVRTEQMARRGRTVIDLDLSHSIAGGEAGFRFVPKYRLVH